MFWTELFIKTRVIRRLFQSNSFVEHVGNIADPDETLRYIECTQIKQSMVNLATVESANNNNNNKNNNNSNSQSPLPCLMFSKR